RHRKTCARSSDHNRYNTWVDIVSPMPLSHSRQIRARRSRKVTDKPAHKTDEAASPGAANLVYAGYPYDPYA
ncbi:MAG: hypothetical protein WBV76_25000, partial [Pseudolabrys sp.]